MRNQAKEAGKWYLELRESGTKYIAIYKERLDSLTSYQRKLNQIVVAYLKPPNEILYTDTVVRAIAELHRIEMSLYTLFKETPVLDIKPDSKDFNTIKNCRWVDIITHCKCKHCKEVWCPTAKGQDWCPNPDCGNGLKGCEFMPWDEGHEWIQCSSCKRWFKLPEILEKHRSINCTANTPYLPPPIEETKEQMHERKSEPVQAEEMPELTTAIGPEIDEQQPQLGIEPEPESEVDRYWRTHKLKPKPKDKTVHYTISEC